MMLGALARCAISKPNAGDDQVSAYEMLCQSLKRKQTGVVLGIYPHESSGSPVCLSPQLLVHFFGVEYVEYRKRSWIGIPFMAWATRSSYTSR